MGKIRLDQLMVSKGLVDSRRQAANLLMAGRVDLDGRRILKPGLMVRHDTKLIIIEKPAFVSRGGTKLAHALDWFQLNVTNFEIIDVGASTGGFTDCLLQNGAAKVYSVDVGLGQLADKIRSDKRVVVMEKINARYPFKLSNKLDMVVIDVSFISLTKVLGAIVGHLKIGGLLLSLVKPQFEARIQEVGKKGIIKDPTIHAKVLGRYINWSNQIGWDLLGLTPSPLLGSKGNREFFVLHRVNKG